MAAGDHAGLIEACARLGDVSRGGDPHLWTEVLQYFGSQQYDCSVQVIVNLLDLSPAHGRKDCRLLLESSMRGFGGARGAKANRGWVLLPPLVLLQAVAAYPQLKLAAIKQYVALALAANRDASENASPLLR